MLLLLRPFPSLCGQLGNGSGLGVAPPPRFRSEGGGPLSGVMSLHCWTNGRAREKEEEEEENAHHSDPPLLLLFPSRLSASLPPSSLFLSGPWTHSPSLPLRRKSAPVGLTTRGRGRRKEK